MVMKKISTSVLSLGLLFGAVSPAFAEEGNIVQQEQEQDIVFNYEHNGIQFSGNFELTEKQLIEMYKETLKNSNSTVGISIMAPDMGGSQVTVVPPMYKTYKNTTEKNVAELITAYLIGKAPKAAKGTTFGAWVLGKLSGWSDNIKPTYVGAWTTSAWDNYYNERRYYNTLVHYKNSNYTTPISVQYWDATALWK